MRGRYTRAGSASLHLFKGRWGWLDVSIEGRAWLNVAYLQLEVRDRRARAGSVAPLHPHEGRRGSFAARLGVSIEGSAQRSDGAFGTSRALLVCGIGGARPLLEGGEHRSPASPRGTARFFCCAVGRFLEGRAQCSDGAFGTSGVPLVCRIGGVQPSREGGERRSPASPQGWRGSFAARLGGSIEGSAQRSDGAFGTSKALLVCGIGGARPLLEGGERRSPASPQGVARFFCCAVGSFLEGRAQCSDGAFGTSGVPLVCRIGGVQPSREGGERRAPASPQEAARFFRCAVGRFC